MSLTKVSYSLITGSPLNVLDYGADPTGVADSTAAIQAAINAGALRTVYFPAGTYKVTSSLTITYSSSYGGVNLVGEGRGSRINWMGGNSTNVIHAVGVGGTGPTSMSCIESLRIVNNNASTGLNGISIGTTLTYSVGVSLVTIRKCVIESMELGIILCTGSDECTVSENHILFGSATGAGLWVESISSGHMIFNNHVQSYAVGHIGFMIKGTAINLLSNVVQSSNRCYAAVVTDGAQGLTITGLYTESQTGATAAILLQSSVGVVIGGCNIQGYPNAPLIRVNATCLDVQILSNHHGQSGGFITALVQVDSGATGVAVLGNFDTTGTIGLMTGALLCRYREASVQFPLGISSIGGEYELNETVSFVNVLAGATTTLFSVIAGGCYMVYITQSTESYGAAGIVFVPAGSSTAQLFPTGSTNANLQLAVSGLNVQAFNGTASTRTITFTALKLANA